VGSINLLFNVDRKILVRSDKAIIHYRKYIKQEGSTEYNRRYYLKKE
jgi:hypothetical protein